MYLTFERVIAGRSRLSRTETNLDRRIVAQEADREHDFRDQG
jgi:hypothetical protein